MSDLAASFGSDQKLWLPYDWRECWRSKSVLRPKKLYSAIGLVYVPYVLQLFNLTQLNSTENYGRRCLTSLKSASSLYTIINKQYHFKTSSDLFPVPVRSAVKSNFTNWCCQNVSKHSLNALIVQASTTELDKLFQIRVDINRDFLNKNLKNPIF